MARRSARLSSVSQRSKMPMYGWWEARTDMKDFQANFRAVLITAEMTLRQTATDGFILFAILVQPLITAILALWMLRGQSADNAIFAVVGSGMSGLWSSLLFIC